MLEPYGSSHHGIDLHRGLVERSRTPGSPPRSEISISKNRSASSLYTHNMQTSDKARSHFSHDASLAAADLSRAQEQDHGNLSSGLRRIRQQPLSRAPTVPSTGTSSPITSSARSNSMSNSMTLTLSTSRAASMSMASGSSSPIVNFTEDLSRFPSESLHSFSFAQQSDELLRSRHDVLKRSVEFLSLKMAWGATNAGIVSAQARVNGDREMQGMLELLAKANLVGANKAGPLTGPAIVDDIGNVFDESFLSRTDTPRLFDGSVISPTSVGGSRLPHPLDSDGLRANENEVGTGSARGPDHLSPGPLATESHLVVATSYPTTTRASLKRTSTDTGPLSLQHQLMDALSEPYIAANASHGQIKSPQPLQNCPIPSLVATNSHPPIPAVHGHSSRWAPAAQAIFTTESTAPYTILAANDLACLHFGVTKGEVRKIGILEFVQKERRSWLEDRLGLQRRASEAANRYSGSEQTSPVSTTSVLLGRSGLTASLLSKPNSRQTAKPGRRAKTNDGAGSSIISRIKTGKVGLHHANNKSRGVLLCGDVVPIQIRNGAIGSASLWVKEKRGGLIWVLEEIHEDVAVISLDGTVVVNFAGSSSAIWGDGLERLGVDIGDLLPTLPRERSSPRSDVIDYVELAKRQYFTARVSGKINVPAMVERVLGSSNLRVSSFPNIAGIMVLSAATLNIISSNPVFSAALFGQAKPNGRPIMDLIPEFNRILKVLTDCDGIGLVDGIVIPEYRFRRARAFLSLRDGTADAASYFLKPHGLPARHRDGSEIWIDAQLRVVKSDRSTPIRDENVIEGLSEDGEHQDIELSRNDSHTELVYALWITYSRHIHASSQNPDTVTTPLVHVDTPRQPSPGQAELVSPLEMDSDEPLKEMSHAAVLKAQLKAAAKKTAAVITGRDPPSPKVQRAVVPEALASKTKKSIDDFVILEEMGQGAYGQVKLARYKYNDNNKIVLKFVTKRRILVDTWTRDRRLGTVPLEIHVLDYLRRDGLKHQNIVEMSDFFEDDVNYYIEMAPHGLPGMDLFDYIELRVNMEENECRSIFGQVAKAVHHLHTKAHVVHRDVKDENVVLDGEGNVRLIDFGSAAYVKSGPFDIFVGTIDYAAPEVLAGKPYRGKEQDVWALGILLYTIVYKENPFYSIDEIMDRELRVPYVMSDDSIDLIRAMLDRDVESRIKIEQVVEHPWLLAAAGG